ncbi:hypothetical protein Tco_0073186 [Tanacetum coccineum]
MERIGDGGSVALLEPNSPLVLPKTTRTLLVSSHTAVGGVGRWRNDAEMMMRWWLTEVVVGRRWVKVAVVGGGAWRRGGGEGEMMWWL